MKRTKYFAKDVNRYKFRIKVPKELWDHLPKFITKELAPAIFEIEYSCVRNNVSDFGKH